MIYSYHWLKELSGTKKTPDQLAKLLMMHAFEVEGVEKYEHGLGAIVIGEVEELEQHPNADRLRVATVRFGRGETKTIVCGAPNIALAQKVAVALPGTILPGGMEIGEAKLRGVLSQGMICSEKELGLGESHDGILVLPEDAPVGALFAKHYGFDDTLIDIKILPDRGSDALSHEGMAREIAALDGYAPRFEERPRKSIKIPSYNRAPKVTVQDKKACPRYAGLFFRGVSVTPSPLWLQVRLLLAGLKPKNNIVDATNYLMLLSGQPVHAFDAAKLQGGIVVRRAKKNEKLTLLNDQAIKLGTEDIVIADQKKALALAGIMGGKQSAVTEKTEDIFIEIAVFDAPSVRKSKVSHNLPTDASYRFERGLDPNLPTEALREAATLFAQLSGGKLAGMRDVAAKKAGPWKIRLAQQLVDDVLGVEVPLFEIVRLLALLGLKVKKLSAQAVLEVTVPTRRPDLKDEWNLIEEIGRMRGYEKIAPAAPLLPLTLPPVNSQKKRERLIKETLADFGFDELMTYSFYGKKDLLAARLPEEHHIMLENPMNPDQEYLRFSLLPTVLRKVRENLRHFDQLSVFEYGSVFKQGGSSAQLREYKDVVLVSVAGAKEKTLPFYQLKGEAVAFLERLGLTDIRFEALAAEHSQTAGTLLHPSRAAAVLAEGKVVGLLGELHPSVAKAFGLPGGRVAVAGFAVAHLAAVESAEPTFEALQKFPYALRDISLWFPVPVTVAEAEQALCDGGGALLQNVELFDTYQKDGEKSLSFHLAFGAADRTLASQEVDAAMERIVALAKERHEGSLRS